ncbi:MAG: prepilin-type N-terminal cleavage/methylation domain-containing protein [Lawsonibacter sp.]
MFKKLSKKKGFTLMEMMIVVAIIAILIAIIIPTFKGALERANAAADEANLRAYYAEVMADAVSEGKDPACS